jgi:hypothetical protein
MLCLPSGFTLALRGDWTKIDDLLSSSFSFDAFTPEQFYPYVEVLFFHPFSGNECEYYRIITRDPLTGEAYELPQMVSEVSITEDAYESARIFTKNSIINHKFKQYFPPSESNQSIDMNSGQSVTLPEKMEPYNSGYTLASIPALCAQWSLEDQVAFDVFLRSDATRNWLCGLPDETRARTAHLKPSDKKSKIWKSTISAWFRYSRNHRSSARSHYLENRTRHRYACKTELVFFDNPQQNYKRVKYYKRLCKRRESIVPEFYETIYLRILKGLGCNPYYYASIHALKDLVREFTGYLNEKEIAP